MNEYVIYSFNPHCVPAITAKTVEANDIGSAISFGGVPINEIICVKLKLPIATDGE